MAYEFKAEVVQELLVTKISKPPRYIVT